MFQNIYRACKKEQETGMTQRLCRFLKIMHGYMREILLFLFLLFQHRPYALHIQRTYGVFIDAAGNGDGGHGDEV